MKFFKCDKCDKEDGSLRLMSIDGETVYLGWLPGESNWQWTKKNYHEETFCKECLIEYLKSQKGDE